MCKALRGVFYAIFSVGLYKNARRFVGAWGYSVGLSGSVSSSGDGVGSGAGVGFGGIWVEVSADVAVAALGRDVEHALITGGQTLFRVGQRGSGQSQLVGEVRLTAQQHLNAVLVGELNITQILDVQRVVPSNRLFSCRPSRILVSVCSALACRPAVSAVACWVSLRVSYSSWARCSAPPRGRNLWAATWSAESGRPAG